MANISQGINLLPSLTKKELKNEQFKGSIILGTSAITFLVALLTAAMLFYNLYLKYKIEGSPVDFIKIDGLENQIDEVNSKIDSKSNLLETYTELATKSSFVKEVLAERPDYKKTLDRVQALLPEGIDITEYSIDESDQIKLTGYAKDYYTIALFISRAQKVDLSEGYMSDFYLENAMLRDNLVEFTLNSVAIFPEEDLEEIIE